MYENGDMLQYYADKARAKKTGKPRGDVGYNPKTDKVEPGYHLKSTRKMESVSRAKKILETITLTNYIDRPSFWSTKNGVRTSKNTKKIEPVEEIPWGNRERRENY